MRGFTSRQRWTLLIGAILANLILGGILISLYDLAINQPDEPEPVQMEDDSPLIVQVTVIVTAIPSDTPTPTAIAQETPLPTLVPTITPTLTTEPTRRDFGEPTKPPYIFPTPIYIPPVLPTRLVPTLAPTRSR